MSRLRSSIRVCFFRNYYQIETYIISERDKTQDVTVKLMDIDSEHLGIPDQEYSCVITMPSNEFQKTCRDLALFSDSLNIKATKGDVVFSGKGDTGGSELFFEQLLADM